MNQDIICAGALTEETLAQAVDTFQRQLRPNRERLLEYYRCCQPIPKGEAVRGRPDNRLRAPFPRYITEVQTGYFLGRPPTLAFAREEDGRAFSRLSAALRLDQLLFDAARDMSVCGAGYRLAWLDRGGLRCGRCDPLQCFRLRDGTAARGLLGAVRLYQEGRQVRGVLYEPERVRPFVWEEGAVCFAPAEENLLGAVPLAAFVNNPEGTGDFEPVTGLVDAYDLLLSGAMDDMQSVAGAFLALYGMQGTTQADIDAANRSRVLSLSEGGRAEFVTKNLNQDALALLEGTLRRSILQLSMTPDLSDESFSGNSSGVALQYKLWGIEQVRAAKERGFSAALDELLAVFSGGLATLGVPAELRGKATFYRNLPNNDAQQAEVLAGLGGLLSRRTILEHLPYVADVDEELRRRAEEAGT